MGDPAFDYDLFISYSRQDAGFARALEAALRAYRPPRSLAQLPRRRLRVFRDEADLVGPELSQALIDHLRRSARLVVICSPAARASRYVGQEIEWFAQHAGAGSIVTLLRDGRPNDEAAAQPDQAAFPDALLQHLKTPLACDYRGCGETPRAVRGGRYRNAWFKMLAEVYAGYGIDRAALEQREQARRRRTGALWALGTTAALLAAVALTLLWRDGRQQERIALSRGIAREANDPARPVDVSLLSALAAVRSAPTPEAYDSLHAALERAGGMRLHRWTQPGPISAVALNAATGRLVAGGDRGLLLLWRGRDEDPVVLRAPDPADAEDARPRDPDPGGGRETRDKENVDALAFSPDGVAIASAYAGRVELWDAAQGVRADSLTGPVRTRALALGRGGTPLAAIGAGETDVHVWGQGAARRLAAGNAPLSALALSPENGILAAGAEDGSVRLWEVANKDAPRGGSRHHASTVTAIALTADAQLVASASRELDLLLWKPDDEEPTVLLRGARSPIEALCFSADGGRLVALDAEGMLAWWDVANRRELRRVPGGRQRDEVHRVSGLSCEPEALAVAVRYPRAPPLLWVRDPDAGPLLASTDLPSQEVLRVAIDTRAAQIVAADRDALTFVWALDRATKPRARLREPIRAVTSAALSADGELVAYGTDDQRIEVWKPGFPHLRLGGAHGGPLSALALGPDKRVLASGAADGTLALWRLPNKTPAVARAHAGQALRALAFTPDGTAFAAGDTGGKLIRWSVEGFPGKPSVLAASGAAILSLAYTADGAMLAAGREDGSIALLDATGGGQQALLGGAQGGVLAVAFSSDGRRLASGHDTGTAILWDVQRGAALSTLRALGASVRGLAFSNDGNTLVVGAGRRILRWNVDLPGWQRLACSRANRNLTRAEWTQYVDARAPFECLCEELACETSVER